MSCCSPDLPVCCTTLFDIAADLRDLAYNAVRDCLGPEACDCLSGYVTVGPPENPLSDYVAVWLTSVAPSRGSADRTGGMKFGMPRATFTIELLESGWPTISEAGGRFIVPSPAEINASARVSMGHAEAAMRAIYNALNNGTLAGCEFQSIGDMVPLAPSGGSVGWRFTVTVGFSWGP